MRSQVKTTFIGLMYHPNHLLANVCDKGCSLGYYKESFQVSAQKKQPLRQYFLSKDIIIIFKKHTNRKEILVKNTLNRVVGSM